MKIKSINDFTLAECQDYLNANPNGEFAQKVSERIQELYQINEVKKEEYDEAYNQYHAFIKQFNHLFVTKQYSDAFILCLNASANPLLSSCARDKGEFLIPYLQRTGTIHVQDNIGMDFIIGILINNGYTKLKLQKNGLLSIFPNVLIGLQGNIITIKFQIPLIVLLVIYPLFFITWPVLICSLKNRRRIIQIICKTLLH